MTSIFIIITLAILSLLLLIVFYIREKRIIKEYNVLVSNYQQIKENLSSAEFERRTLTSSCIVAEQNLIKERKQISN